LLKHPTLIRETQYKTYKKKLNHLIRIANKFQIDDKFQLPENNLKETWKLINEVTNKKKQKQSLPSTFQVGDRLVTHTTEIANGFCKFFSNIGPSLANKIPAVTSSFRDCLGPANSETIFLKPTSLTELRHICISFKTGKAPGYDNITMHLIKNSFEFIADPLMHLIKISLETGVFPDKLKMAKTYNPYF
jgi:hypothetical protein